MRALGFLLILQSLCGIKMFAQDKKSPHFKEELTHFLKTKIETYERCSETKDEIVEEIEVSFFSCFTSQDLIILALAFCESEIYTRFSNTNKTLDNFKFLENYLEMLTDAARKQIQSTSLTSIHIESGLSSEAMKHNISSVSDSYWMSFFGEEQYSTWRENIRFILSEIKCEIPKEVEEAIIPEIEQHLNRFTSESL